MQWPIETIKELIEKAEEDGESVANLSSPKEAELFRYAIKNYKRRHKVGENLTTNVVKNDVIIRRKAQVRIGGSGAPSRVFSAYGAKEGTTSR